MIGRLGRNIGSKATSSASIRALKTASGSDRRMITSGQSSMGPKRRIHKGSPAGYRDDKKLRLEMNGTGYANPRNQRARYSKKNLNMQPYQTSYPTFNRSQDRIIDTRPFRSSNGSIGILRDRL